MQQLYDTMPTPPEPGTTATAPASHPADVTNTTIKLATAKVVQLLFGIAGLLLLAHVLTYLLIRRSADQSFTLLLDRLFNLSNENNFPTFFSSFLLLLAAVLLFFISFLHKKNNTQKFRRHWQFLGFVFLFLSLDEATQLHERLNLLSQSLFPTEGSDYLYFAWVIPYAALVMVLFLFYLRFIFTLPPKTRNLFLVSGFIFVAGALGLEFFEGNEVKTNGHTATYWMMITIEEVCEMSGVILFIYALLDYMAPLNKKLLIV